MAYDKYQEHKATKLAIARGSSPDPNHSRIEQDALPEAANAEIMENADVAPPRYEDLIVKRAIIPPEQNIPIDNKTNWATVDGEEKPGYDSQSDVDSLKEGVDAMRVSNERDVVGGTSRSDKFKAWKAEKAARRAERRGRCGGCC